MADVFTPKESGIVVGHVRFPDLCSSIAATAETPDPRVLVPDMYERELLPGELIAAHAASPTAVVDIFLSIYDELLGWTWLQEISWRDERMAISRAVSERWHEMWDIADLDAIALETEAEWEDTAERSARLERVVARIPWKTDRWEKGCKTELQVALERDAASDMKSVKELKKDILCATVLEALASIKDVQSWKLGSHGRKLQVVPAELPFSPFFRKWLVNVSTRCAEATSGYSRKKYEHERYLRKKGLPIQEDSFEELAVQQKVEAADNVEESAIANITITAWLNSLRGKQREVAMKVIEMTDGRLPDRQDHAIKTAADALGIKTKTADTHWRRAKEKLRKFL